VQDEAITGIELGRVQYGFPGVQDMGIACNAPRLVTVDSVAILAGGVGGVTIAVKPSV
jgi:hypothetical protein